MIKLKINNWKWFIEDNALLHGWFEHWEDFAENFAVKKNPVRVVFKVDDLFYVKLEKPIGSSQKLRSILYPKAQKEFAIGRALELAGVPVVKHLGWAKNASSNMLLTEALTDSLSVLEYWYSEIVYGDAPKKEFLEDFAEFLKLFFASGFYHPDFHIGNILYSPTTRDFSLVDVYGVSQPKKLSPQQINKHSSVFFELYRGLSNSEGVDFLRWVKSELSLEKAQDFWQAGLNKRIAHAQKDWSKREQQIQENYSKFIKVLNIAEHEFLVRKMPGPKETVSIENIPNHLTGNYFDIMRLTQDEAEKLWLESFRLELLGIDHLRPLVFEKPNILYFEKAPLGAHQAPQDKAEEFIAYAKNAGVEVAPENLLQLANGRIVIKKILFA
jgi:hypothetical protein